MFTQICTFGGYKESERLRSGQSDQPTSILLSAGCTRRCHGNPTTTCEPSSSPSHQYSVKEKGTSMRIRPRSPGLQIFTTLSCDLLVLCLAFCMTHTLSSLKHRSQRHNALTSLNHSLGVEPKPAAQNPICLRLCITRPHMHAHTLTLSRKDSKGAPKKSRGEP